MYENKLREVGSGGILKIILEIFGENWIASAGNKFQSFGYKGLSKLSDLDSSPK